MEVKEIIIEDRLVKIFGYGKMATII